MFKLNLFSGRRKTRFLYLVAALSTMLITACASVDLMSTAEPASQAQTQFLQVGDNTYAYRSLGASSSVPLIMMTRYRANMDDWDPAFLNALASERRVVVFNQSGVASSTGTTPSNIGGMAADVAKFAGALGYEKIDVLGWSMAGFTAQAIAADFPDLVRRVILIGTGPAASDVTPPPKAGVFDVATKAPRADGETIYSDNDRAYLFFTDHPASLEYANASFERIDQARRTDEPLASAAVQEAQTAAILNFWLEPDNGYFKKLQTIRQPSFIINGDRDAFFTVEASNILYREISQSRLAILPMAGHGPQHQHPELVAGMINDFLE